MSFQLRHTKLIHKIKPSTTIVCYSCGAEGCVRYWNGARLCSISEGWSSSGFDSLIVFDPKIRPADIQYYCSNCTMIKEIIE